MRLFLFTKDSFCRACPQTHTTSFTGLFKNEICMFFCRMGDRHHFVLWLKGECGGLCHNGTRRQFFNTLPDDVVRLPHFQHSATVSVVGITFCPDRNFKLNLIICIIRKMFSDIIGNTGTSQCRSCKSPVNCFFCRDNANSYRSLEPYPVLIYESFILQNP